MIKQTTKGNDLHISVTLLFIFKEKRLLTVLFYNNIMILIIIIN